VQILPMGCYLMAVLLLFEIGRRAFETSTGLFAALVLLMHPFMLETSVRDNFTDPVLMAVLLLAVLCVLLAGREGTAQPARWLVVGGIGLGLAQYARSAGMMLYVPMTVLLLTVFREKRVMRFAVFAASCLATQLPLFVWNVEHVGTPTFTPTYVFLSLTRSFPGFSAFALLLPTSLREVARLYGGEIALKWLSQVWVHAKYFFTFTSPVLLTAGLLSWTLPLNGPQRALRTFTAVLYVCLVALDSLFAWDNRYLLPVVPFVALLGFECLRRLVSAAPLPAVGKFLTAASLGALISISGIDLFFQLSKTASREAEFARLRDSRERARFIVDNLRRTDIVLTADPGLLAWETGDTAVALPLNPEMAAAVHDRFVAFNTMLLETRRPRGDLFGYAEDWYRVAAGEQAFMKFRREGSVTLSSGQTLVLLRADGAN
jgi:Dolichyl-phosphate-mannose-protein mannosyltransferase